MARIKYDKEFKLEAVRLVLEGGYSQRQAAESLGINVSTLKIWIDRLRHEFGQPPGRAGPRRKARSSGSRQRMPDFAWSVTFQKGASEFCVGSCGPFAGVIRAAIVRPWPQTQKRGKDRLPPPEGQRQEAVRWLDA